MKTRCFSIFLASLSSWALASPPSSNRPEDLVPPAYAIQSTIQGDLNKDGQADYVFLVKGTDKRRFVKDDIRGIVDRNRRGILIAIQNNGRYELALQNTACFSSDQEDGGAYFAPELDVSIQKGNLVLDYAHGRYGYWSYKFRHHNADFELIGYDRVSSNGPDVERELSVNLLTRKAIIRRRDDADPSGKLQERRTSFALPQPVRLAQIQDFDDLDVETLLGLH